MKTYYAKPLKSFGDFKKGNLYEIEKTNGQLIKIKNDKNVFAWHFKDLFEIVNCIFNETE